MPVIISMMAHLPSKVPCLAVARKVDLTSTRGALLSPVAGKAKTLAMQSSAASVVTRTTGPVVTCTCMAAMVATGRPTMTTLVIITEAMTMLATIKVATWAVP